MSDRPIVDDLSIEDVPDEKPVTRRQSSTPTSRAKTKPTPPYKEGALIEPLTRFYATMGVGLLPVAPRTAEQVMMNGEACAKAWDNWARTSPAVRRMLYPLLNMSAAAEVFAAHLPIVFSVVVEAKPDSNMAGFIQNYLDGMSTMMKPDDDNAN